MDAIWEEACAVHLPCWMRRYRRGAGHYCDSQSQTNGSGGISRCKTGKVVKRSVGVPSGRASQLIEGVGRYPGIAMAAVTAHQARRWLNRMPFAA